MKYDPSSVGFVSNLPENMAWSVDPVSFVSVWRLVVNSVPPTFNLRTEAKWTCLSFFATESKASFSLRTSRACFFIMSYAFFVWSRASCNSSWLGISTFFSSTDMMFKKRWDQIETETKPLFFSRKWRVGIRWICTITTDQRKCRLAHTLRKHQNGKAGMPEMPAVFGLVLLRVKIVGSHPRPSLTKRTAVLQTTSGPTEKGVCLRVCQ